jgi:hypothetical protein
MRTDGPVEKGSIAEWMVVNYRIYRCPEDRK